MAILDFITFSSFLLERQLLYHPLICATILASTDVPDILGLPTCTLLPSSVSKTLSKETFEPSFASILFTKSF